jgi:hypothetical protein
VSLLKTDDCLQRSDRLDRVDRHGSQSHEAALESYADASQSLPYRGSVEIEPSTAQFTSALRENDRPTRSRNAALDF